MDKIEELYNLLCSDGFLPPRNEEELLETEKRMVDYQFKNDGRHVDVHAIINDASCEIVNMKRFDEGVEAEPLGMAARNFEKLPQKIIDKIKEQHQKNDKDTE
jgi:hypothetical protein